MDGLGDIFYIFIFILITVFGAVSKSKEKKNKKVVRPSVMSNAEPPMQDDVQPLQDNNSDVLINEMAEKLKREEQQRLDEERTQLREVSELINVHKDESEVQKKAEQIKAEDEKEERIIEELEDDARGIDYDVNFSDVDQVRKAFISAEILNKKY